MALIKCKNCNSDISDKAIKCPKCGTVLNENGKNKKNLYISIFILVVLILLSIFTICNEVEYGKSLLSSLNAQDYKGFIEIFLNTIVYDMMRILFLWFLFAFWKFQKKTFRAVSLIFLILSIICFIIPYFIASGFGFESLKYFCTQIWVSSEKEIILLILLYLFCQKNKQDV